MNWDDAFWVVDVEGNGARPPEMVELAMIEIRSLLPTGTRRHWLIRPQEPISSMATRIHGIRNEDLMGAPAFDDIAEDVLTLITGKAIVGHNVRVELDILQRALPTWEPTVAIDTLRLTKAIRPGLPSYSLSNLTESLHLCIGESSAYRKGEHSAPHDAMATSALFAQLLQELPVESRSAFLESANVVERKTGFLL